LIFKCLRIVVLPQEPLFRRPEERKYSGMPDPVRAGRCRYKQLSQQELSRFVADGILWFTVVDIGLGALSALPQLPQ
jgi:hypothetical protein